MVLPVSNTVMSSFLHRAHLWSEEKSMATRMPNQVLKKPELHAPLSQRAQRLPCIGCCKVRMPRAILEGTVYKRQSDSTVYISKRLRGISRVCRPERSLAELRLDFINALQVSVFVRDEA